MKPTKRALSDMKFTALHYPTVSIALLAAAVASLIFAGLGARQFTKHIRTSALVKDEQKGGLIKLNKRPVNSAELETLMDVLRQNHPSLQISTSSTPGSMIITASSPDSYREWMSALGTLQGAGKAGSVWLATELCVASCGDVALKAEVQGITQFVTKGV